MTFFRKMARFMWRTTIGDHNISKHSLFSCSLSITAIPADCYKTENFNGLCAVELLEGFQMLKGKDVSTV